MIDTDALRQSMRQMEIDKTEEELETIPRLV